MDMVKYEIWNMGYEIRNLNIRYSFLPGDKKHGFDLLVPTSEFLSKIGLFCRSLIQFVTAESMGTGISEASKRVPIFDRETGSQPERLRSGSLQADLSLIV